jgi:Uma2 family endonuclease
MIQTLTQPLPGTVVDPLYPDEDGRPMDDTDYHSSALVALREGLEDVFRDRPDVYVGMNLIFYYEHGNPRARRDPDILVAKGVAGKHKRRSFRLWEEKVLPCTLLEVVSKKTVQVDISDKRLLYERLRIPEYFLFDPEGKYLDRPLRGFRLRRGRYVELKPAADGSLISRQLGLRLLPEGELLRLIDLKTGEAVRTPLEKLELAQNEAARHKRRADQERRRALAEQRRAEEERQRALVEQQRAEEERKRALAEQQRAEEERKRALAEQQRAEEERQRAETLAAEVQRLRELLRGQRRPNGR